MKKKLLAIGAITLEILIGIYIVEMLRGWQVALRVLGAIGILVGLFAALIITSWAVEELFGGNSDDYSDPF